MNLFLMYISFKALYQRTYEDRPYEMWTFEEFRRHMTPY